MFENISKTFEFLDNKIGPSKKKHKRACMETREMLFECVMMSECFKNHEKFKYCMQDGISKECKAIRYDYFLCKRGQVFWEKSFNRDDPR